MDKNLFGALIKLINVNLEHNVCIDGNFNVPTQGHNLQQRLTENCQFD